MINPPDAARPRYEGVPISNQFVVAQTETQRAYPFTELQLRRIKESINSTHSPESQWVAGAAAAFGTCISFAIGAVGLQAQQGVASWLLSLFWVVAGAGFIMAITCGIAFWSSRNRRKYDVSRTIQMIEDIESTYTVLPQHRVSE